MIKMTTQEMTKLIEGYRGKSLADLYPNLAKEWHPTKNGDLTPEMVLPGSNKKVWWCLPYVNSKTGKTFNFEWESVIGRRASGAACPFITGHAVYAGFNDLATTNPELATQWHPTKNGNLTPKDVTATSGKKVWWFLPYDDPKTGKHFDFEWESSIGNRTVGDGCPFLSGHKIWIGFNDLATVHPELCKEWHPTKNGNLTPKDVTATSGKKVWWFLPYDDPKTGRHFDFEWESTIAKRTKDKRKCPFLSGQSVFHGFNDLATVNPELAAEWHPTKNGQLTPHDVTHASLKSVWWYFPYNDPKTGKHFDFEWKTTVANRTRKSCNYGCPFLSNQAVWPGFNDLATVNPELAAEWHPTKNDHLTPQMVTAGSQKSVWWFLPYDDPKTGKHFDFEWQTGIMIRARGLNCPFLSGRAVWQGFNDLSTTNPEIASQWHPTKNGNLTPNMITANSNKNVWWLLPYDDIRTGKHFDFEWQTAVCHRTSGHSNCPFLSNSAVWSGFNDLYTVNPEIAAQWHPTKNKSLTPKMVTAGSTEMVWWCYPYYDANTGKHFVFEWKAKVFKRTKYSGKTCPFLSGRALWPGFNDLATVDSRLAADWHPSKNNTLTPQMVTSNSGKKVWWICKNGHEWRSSIDGRRSGRGCPCCNMSKGEARLFEFCKNHNIISQKQYRLNDCVHKKELPFDVAVFHKNGKLAFLVEYDGEQHFKPVDFSGKGDAKEVFKGTQIRDRIKSKYCREKRIPLVRISYKDYDNIEKILLKKMVRYGLM